MNRSSVLRLALAMLLPLAEGQTPADARKGQAPAPKTEIVLCGGVVPVAIMQANATFQVFYQLETGPSGQVRHVKKIRNAFLPDGDLVGCLSRWVLPVPAATVDVSLTWKHGAGWTEIAVVMPGNQVRRIAFDPGWP